METSPFAVEDVYTELLIDVFYIFNSTVIDWTCFFLLYSGAIVLALACFRYKQQPWVVSVFVAVVCKEASKIAVRIV